MEFLFAHVLSGAAFSLHGLAFRWWEGISTAQPAITGEGAGYSDFLWEEVQLS